MNLPDWQECERISNLPDVDETLRGFLADPTGDNGICVVRAIRIALEKELRDVKRYHFLRSMKDMSEDEVESVAEAMAAIYPKDMEGVPTDEQFDASVDAAIKLKEAENGKA